jgi:hypothetical protein
MVLAKILPALALVGLALTGIESLPVSSTFNDGNVFLDLDKIAKGPF